jgi:hypothetical protein
LLHTIRIPEEHWGRVWRALVATGPVFRETVEPIYVIDDKQLRMLRRRKLPFEILADPFRTLSFFRSNGDCLSVSRG